MSSAWLVAAIMAKAPASARMSSAGRRERRHAPAVFGLHEAGVVLDGTADLLLGHESLARLELDLDPFLREVRGPVVHLPVGDRDDVVGKRNQRRGFR